MRQQEATPFSNRAIIYSIAGLLVNLRKSSMTYLYLHFYLYYRYTFENQIVTIQYLLHQLFSSGVICVKEIKNVGVITKFIKYLLCVGSITKFIKYYVWVPEHFYLFSAL